jgi:glyoxylase-like metal-dependent hydrolase (beta-lactamase superfamily II)
MAGGDARILDSGLPGFDRPIVGSRSPGRDDRRICKHPPGRRRGSAGLGADPSAGAWAHHQRAVLLRRTRRADLIYSHHHADHAAASSLFDRKVARIGHEETRNLLLGDDDPAMPAPEETFQDRRAPDIEGERIELAWHGSNHSPGGIFLDTPDDDRRCSWASATVVGARHGKPHRKLPWVP